MRKQTARIFTADFETTVFEGQKSTEVWAAAIVELNTEDVQIFNTIDGLFEYILSIDSNTIIYFHNLKFDGEFILHYLITNGNFTQAFITDNPDKCEGSFIEKKYMEDKTFRYSISSKGMWYSITLKNGRYFIEFRDSYKLIPTSVKRIGQSFGTKHHKTSIEYTGFRQAGGEITEEEKEYISNDVLVVKEAIEIMYSQGHRSLTIGACCLEEYKANCPLPDYDKAFPNLYEISIDKETFGAWRLYQKFLSWWLVLRS